MIRSRSQSFRSRDVQTLDYAHQVAHVLCTLHKNRTPERLHQALDRLYTCTKDEYERIQKKKARSELDNRYVSRLYQEAVIWKLLKELFDPNLDSPNDSSLKQTQGDESFSSFVKSCRRPDKPDFVRQMLFGEWLEKTYHGRSFPVQDPTPPQIVLQQLYQCVRSGDSKRFGEIASKDEKFFHLVPLSVLVSFDDEFKPRNNNHSGYSSSFSHGRGTRSFLLSLLRTMLEDESANQNLSVEEIALYGALCGNLGCAFLNDSDRISWESRIWMMIRSRICTLYLEHSKAIVKEDYCYPDDLMNRVSFNLEAVEFAVQSRFLPKSESVYHQLISSIWESVSTLNCSTSHLEQAIKRTLFATLSESDEEFFYENRFFSHLSIAFGFGFDDQIANYVQVLTTEKSSHDMVATYCSFFRDPDFGKKIYFSFLKNIEESLREEYDDETVSAEMRKFSDFYREAGFDPLDFTAQFLDDTSSTFGFEHDEMYDGEIRKHQLNMQSTLKWMESVAHFADPDTDIKQTVFTCCENICRLLRRSACTFVLGDPVVFLSPSEISQNDEIMRKALLFFDKHIAENVNVIDGHKDGHDFLSQSVKREINLWNLYSECIREGMTETFARKLSDLLPWKACLPVPLLDSNEVIPFLTEVEDQEYGYTYAARQSVIGRLSYMFLEFCASHRLYSNAKIFLFYLNSPGLGLFESMIDRDRQMCLGSATRLLLQERGSFPVGH